MFAAASISSATKVNKVDLPRTNITLSSNCHRKRRAYMNRKRLIARGQQTG